MYLQRPDEKSGGSRFLLALSLSTVTALAVAAPLAFRAVTVDSDLGGADADVNEINDTSIPTTEPPSGPQIGPKVRSPQAKLPIAPGLPSDYPTEPTAEIAPAPTPAPSRQQQTTVTTAATTARPTTTSAPSTTSSSTSTTAASTTSTTVTVTSTSTSTSLAPSSTSIDLDTSSSTS